MANGNSDSHHHPSAAAVALTKSVDAMMQTLSDPLIAGRKNVVESAISAVSWPAIIAGAFAMAAVALILLALGSGLGFASLSPWYNSGPSATTFGVLAAIWLIIVQWLSAALGGYVTGRLRTKWVGVHTDEVYFRDTVHGFLAWAVAAVVMAAALSFVASSVVGSAARGAGSLATAAVQAAGTAAAQSGGLDPVGYRSVMAAALSFVASSVVGSAARGSGSLATAAVQAAGPAAAQSGDIDPMGY